MNTKRTHVVLSEQSVKDIDERIDFISQALEKELVRRTQLAALDAVAGAWKDEDHPELRSGAAHWVSNLRQENERRLRSATTR